MSPVLMRGNQIGKIKVEKNTNMVLENISSVKVTGDFEIGKRKITQTVISTIKINGQKISSFATE